MLSIPIRLGAIAGLVSGLWIGFQNSTGNALSAARAQYLLPLLLLTGILFAMYFTRKNEKDGLLDFRATARAGAISTLVTSLFLAAIIFGYHRWFNPEWAEIRLAEAVEFWEKNNYTPVNIDELSLKLREDLSPARQAFRKLTMTLAMGIPFSMLAAFFMKKTK